MLTVMNSGLRSQRTAKCPGRAMREAAVAGADVPVAATVELGAIVEVAGGVQVIEFIDPPPDTAHALPVVRPILRPHHKDKHPVGV